MPLSKPEPIRPYKSDSGGETLIADPLYSLAKDLGIDLKYSPPPSEDALTGLGDDDVSGIDERLLEWSVELHLADKGIDTFMYVWNYKNRPYITDIEPQPFEDYNFPDEVYENDPEIDDILRKSLDFSRDQANLIDRRLRSLQITDAQGNIYRAPFLSNMQILSIAPPPLEVDGNELSRSSKDETPRMSMDIYDELITPKMSMDIYDELITPKMDLSREDLTQYRTLGLASTNSSIAPSDNNSSIAPSDNNSSIAPELDEYAPSSVGSYSGAEPFNSMMQINDHRGSISILDNIFSGGIFAGPTIKDLPPTKPPSNSFKPIDLFGFLGKIFSR